MNDTYLPDVIAKFVPACTRTGPAAATVISLAAEIPSASFVDLSVINPAPETAIPPPSILRLLVADTEKVDPEVNEIKLLKFESL